MALAKYPPMSAELRESQKNDSTHNPGSEVRIPDQTVVPVITIEFLNSKARKELTMGDEKPVFPLLYEDVEGPMEPEQLVYLHVTDDGMEEWGAPKESLALLNPNVQARSGDLACIRWKDRWAFVKLLFADDGHIELLYAPGKSLWIDAEEKEQLEIIAPVETIIFPRPVKNAPKYPETVESCADKIAAVVVSVEQELI